MTVPGRIVVERGPGETRAALLADGVALEVVHVRDAEAQPGAIYAGRIGERLPGGDGVFVDLGLPPPGLLEAKGARFSQGQLVAVEVLSPARAEKGPKLGRVKATVPSVQAAPGVIVPAPDPVQAWWACHAKTIAVIDVAPRAEARRLAELLGAAAPVVGHADPLFADLEDQIDAALAPVVPLPGGGRLVIEPTCALVAVDIDAGAARPEAANAAAMAALAHHMRLRNLAGRIVVDLIPTRAPRRFVGQLRELCRDDPAGLQIMGLSPSGLIDILRRRTRPSLRETLCDAAGQPSPATVAYRALRLAWREFDARKTAHLNLAVAAEVQALLNERLAPALAEARTRGEIAVVAAPGFPRARIEIS
jgi:Ribonuclease G/E